MPFNGLTVHVLALRKRADRATRQAADEAASAVRALGGNAVLVEGALDAVGADALVVVAAEGIDLHPMEEGGSLEGRAVGLLGVARDAAEGSALLQAARRALRERGAYVLNRQVVLRPEQFSVQGLEDEVGRERLHSLVELVLVEGDRLKSAREGWEAPPERPRM